MQERNTSKELIHFINNLSQIILIGSLLSVYGAF